MGRLKDAIKHAFAVEAPGTAEPTEFQREMVDRVCREIVRRRMATPALLFLEMSRPLNFVSAHAMHFFRPIVSVVLDTRGYEQFALFLEKRGSMEYICRRIEALEDERDVARGGVPDRDGSATRQVRTDDQRESNASGL